MKYIPHLYQEGAIQHLLNCPKSGLILEMGLGKSSITLTALKTLLRSVMIRKPLIIAPKRVTEHVWTAELGKWDHLKGLKISKIVGTPAERIAALNAKADIYAVSRDNLKWLVEYYGRKWPYDMVVVDESSSFKNPASGRFKALRKVLGLIDRVVLLTGTPSPNGLLDLWSQIYLLDKGERLQKTLGAFREMYFQPTARGYGGHVLSYDLKKNADVKIYEKIEDICISMKAKDWLQLKPREDRVYGLELPNMEGYQEFKRKEFLQLEDTLITPLNAAGLYNKLLQFCNGAVYDSAGAYHVVSDAKLDVLDETVEALLGEPVIIFYNFKSDIERIKARIPGVVQLHGNDEIDAWNRGEIKVLLAHPASCGHGLNLQDGGHNIIWFGLPWSLELYLQAVARLDRQGQKKAVINLAIICKGTIEEMVAKRLTEKGITQDELIEFIRWQIAA